MHDDVLNKLALDYNIKRLNTSNTEQDFKDIDSFIVEHFDNHKDTQKINKIGINNDQI